MKTYLALIKIDMKLALRMRSVIFFNYLFPLMFFFIFALLFRARTNPGAMIQVLSMVIPLGVVGNGLFGAGMRSIQEREMGILRRYKVTPITPGPLLVASMVTALFVFMPYILVVLSIAHFYYHMAWPANWLSILIFISLGLVAFRSLGMVIASTANNMQEGQILIQLCYFPMIFLSGATIPIDLESFPQILRTISNFIPSTYLVRGIREMMFTGKSILDEWELVLILMVAAAVGLTVGFKLFRWEKEEKIRPSAKLWVAAVILPFLIWGVVKYVKGEPAPRHSQRNQNSGPTQAKQFFSARHESGS
ncbi:MAG TPA: ABC transporter permease [Verrucomicrobiae bacterium]|jgi:ABC-2 type transport system permease protein|nr:ABC transporter permease [Verrucomicrobiae bacterium]